MRYVVDVGALIEVQDKDPRSAVLLALLARRQERGREFSPPPPIADVLDLNSGEMVRFILQPEAAA
jgi:hypothetical protein